MYRHNRKFPVLENFMMEIPFDQSLGAERGLCRWSDLKYMSSLSPNRQVIPFCPEDGQGYVCTNVRKRFKYSRFSCIGREIMSEN